MIFNKISTTCISIVIALSLATITVYAQQENSIVISEGSSSPANDKFFVPQELTVKSGTTITWINEDNTIHSIKEGKKFGNESPKFDTTLEPEDTFEYAFDEPGEYEYHSVAFPWMEGKIIVK